MSMFKKLRFRNSDGFIVPRGPDFEQAQFIRMHFGGSEISFKCPQHDPWDRCVESFQSSDDIALYEPRSYDETCTFGEFEGGNWFYRMISFYGPILTGVAADFDVSVLNYRKKLTSDLQTFFNATFFEGEVISYLTSRFGSDTFEGRSDWSVPDSWGIQICGDVTAICASVKSSETRQGMLYEKLFIPVADDCFICLFTSMALKMAGNLDTQLETRDIKPLQELSDQILSSVSVKLSKQSKEQLAKAQAQFPTSKFSDHVAPLDWVSTNQNDE